MLNFNHLYYFHVVATAGSLANAAEQLDVAQSTVSEQLRQLERRLDRPLFARTAQGLRLTQQGRQVLAHTNVMFQAADRLIADIAGDRTVQKMLRVGITASVARSLATDFLTPLLRLPECVPNIRTTEQSDLFRQLRGNELDLILCEEQIPAGAQAELRSVELYRPALVAVVAPEKAGQAASLAESTLPLMNYLPESPWRWEIDAFLKERAPNVVTMGETDDTQLMLESAQRGLCIAIIPRRSARRSLVDGRLQLLAELPQSEIAVHAIHRIGRQDDLAKRAAALLLEHANRDGESVTKA